MAKTIKFKALDKDSFDIQPKPFPASKAIPKWFKDLPPYDKGRFAPEGNRLSVQEGMANFSPKKCTPMLDAITSGYIVPLWADVMINWVDGEPTINWRTKSQVFTPHGTSAKDVLAPPGYVNRVAKYMNTWIPITPKGYSVLVTSPFGYKDLPFHAIPAVVDSDKSLLDLVFPVWIKEGYEGLVEKGTPIVQITPFKREDWVSEFEYFEDGEFDKIQEQTFNSTIVSHYIKNVWSKKTYK